MGLPGAAGSPAGEGCKAWPQIHQRLVGIPWPKRIKQGLTQHQNKASSRAGGRGWAVKRASTRLTLPSRIGNGALKALERMLPAVVRPMPGKDNQPCKVRGGWPTTAALPHVAGGPVSNSRGCHCNRTSSREAAAKASTVGNAAIQLIQ